MTDVHSLSQLSGRHLDDLPSLEGAGSGAQLLGDGGELPIPGDFELVVEPAVADPAHERELRADPTCPVSPRRVAILDEGFVLGSSFVVGRPRPPEFFLDSVRTLGVLSRFGLEVTGERTLVVDGRADWEHLGGAAAVLGAQTNANYFHWLFESVARVQSLHELGVDPDAYLVPQLRPWQRGLLEIVGVKLDRCVEVSGAETVFADRLIVASRGLGNIHTFTSGSADWLASLAPAPSNRTRRLYVARDPGASRRVLNEGQLDPVLEEFGFETVRPEALPVDAQMALFAKAEVVAGALGAGLVNAVFAAPGTALIEFAPEGRSGDATLFRNLAVMRGLRFGCVVSPVAEGSLPGRPRDRQHFLVDPATVRRLLRSILD